jgi:hypothetical protein
MAHAMERAALALGSSDIVRMDDWLDEERRAVDVRFLAVMDGRSMERVRGINMTVVGVF